MYITSHVVFLAMTCFPTVGCPYKLGAKRRGSTLEYRILLVGSWSLVHLHSGSTKSWKKKRKTYPIGSKQYYYCEIYLEFWYLFGLCIVYILFFLWLRLYVCLLIISEPLRIECPDNIALVEDGRKLIRQPQQS